MVEGPRTGREGLQSSLGFDDAYRMQKQQLWGPLDDWHLGIGTAGGCGLMTGWLSAGLPLTTTTTAASATVVLHPAAGAARLYQV